MIDALIGSLSGLGIAYVQPGGGYALSGTKVVCKRVDIFNRPKIWIEQVEVQHSHYSYLQLLNAPLIEGAPNPWPPTQLPD